MLYSRSFLFLTLSALILHSCKFSAPLIEDEELYEADLESWTQKRLERLKSESGWLNLAGLFWLKEGINSFGSDPSNDLVFPDKAAAFCGHILLNKGQIVLKALPEAGITWQDSLVSTLRLEHDQANNTTYLDQGDLAWFIIKRDQMFGIRLRDLQHPRLKELEHIPAFPVHTDYVVEARLEKFKEVREFEVSTPVEGFYEHYDCPGILHFELKGQELILYPFSSGEGYFLVFADETTGRETYGAGRFLYVRPDQKGRIILDFNRAYNPPCAFSPFATCPRPPRENDLPVAIEAGEKALHLY